MSTANETHHITLQIKALGNGPQHHIDLAVTAGALRDVVESSKPFPSEFYQSGCVVGKTNIPAGRDYQSIPDVKPTFTQAMSDAGELPPIGSQVLYNVCNTGAEGSKINDEHHGSKATVLSYHRGLLVIGGDEKFFTLSCNNAWIKPIDSRTDEERIRDELTAIWDEGDDKWQIINEIITSPILTVSLKVK